MFAVIKLCYYFVIAICLYVEKSNAGRYGDRFNELQSKNGQLTWTPKRNKLFENRDESEMKRFLGVDRDKFQNAQRLGGRSRNNVRHPEKGHRGGGEFGSGRGRWKDSDRYRPNYWEQGSNRRGFGSMGNNGKWNWNRAGAEDTNDRGGQFDRNRGEENRFNNREFGNGGGGNKGNGRGEFEHHGRKKRAVLPKNFDWRDYSDCQSLDDIRYQECGDCWSVASAAVMSDRYCLWTHKNRFFSARQITACVYPTEGGCNGGWPKDAMEMYKSKGIASGGDPTIKDEPSGCLPYPDELDNKAKCPVVCDRRNYPLDVTKAGDWYEITSRNVTEIMEEIYNYGPVVTIFEVFDDFGYMGEGVYQHVSGSSQGYHSVRIIGWGIQSGVPYWIVANSWGNDWGDNGYFKILKGQNHCNIESWVTCVYPYEAYN